MAEKFLVPQLSIKVGSEKIEPEEFPVMDLNVLMSATYDMSSCDFTVAGLFDEKNGKFHNDMYEIFKPGSLTKVEIGYGKPLKTVFQGYINKLAFDFNGQSGPGITVHCLDAKGALVNNMPWGNYGSKTIKTIVEDILTQKCGHYATIEKVESTIDGWNTEAKNQAPKIRKGVDDYEYLKGIAQKTNNSFCVIADKLYFCGNLEKTAEQKVELKWGKDLLKFQADIEIAEQVSSIIIFGKNPKTKEKFSAKLSSPNGMGRNGFDVVRNRIMQIEQKTIENQSQAADLAKFLLGSREGSLVKCKGSTVGNPEIIAGDKIKISGMGKGANGVYFLTHVTHQMDGQGYITSFEGTSSKVGK